MQRDEHEDDLNNFMGTPWDNPGRTNLLALIEASLGNFEVNFWGNLRNDLDVILEKILGKFPKNNT